MISFRLRFARSLFACARRSFRPFAGVALSVVALAQGADSAYAGTELPINGNVVFSSACGNSGTYAVNSFTFDLTSASTGGKVQETFQTNCGVATPNGTCHPFDTWPSKYPNAVIPTAAPPYPVRWSGTLSWPANSISIKGKYHYGYTIEFPSSSYEHTVTATYKYDHTDKNNNQTNGQTCTVMTADVTGDAYNWKARVETAPLLRVARTFFAKPAYAATNGGCVNLVYRPTDGDRHRWQVATVKLWGLRGEPRLRKLTVDQLPGDPLVTKTLTFPNNGQPRKVDYCFDPDVYPQFRGFVIGHDLSASSSSEPSVTMLYGVPFTKSLRAQVEDGLSSPWAVAALAVVVSGLMAGLYRRRM